MSAKGSSNPTGSKDKKTKADKNKEQNDQDNVIIDGIDFGSTIKPGLRDKRQPINPNSPGKKIVDKEMEKLAKAKEKKKRELQAGRRKP
ncbi:hypothetical protein BOTNAR_0231g00110 [Botryotinia narcissicola]|uniref:Uncharacterized protein n=1 Tax=Botryotinia narcissicola TaxID=278944 RepID=A0A4Z1I450_9HELO|nr:hypothetical protein BOTNAR_0231g00110 [Botryotinia narcissicola]